MSIILASLVSLYLYLMPTAMMLWYKQKGSTTIIVFLINFFGGWIFGAGWIVAFIIAAICIGIANTTKSLLFAAFLIIVTVVCAAAELATLAALIGVAL